MFLQKNITEVITIQPITHSDKMKSIVNLAKRVAPYPTTVLISGETGVGKEVLASYIHQNSERASHNFVKVNCGAIPESLLDSELFGYEPGAFTGARREGSQGLFEAANHGTILLDEISELPPKAQSKLLRALQEREVRRVGGTWSKNIDVRVLAATNQNLKELVEKKLFRKDLFYRLQVVQIEIPPLRERPEDIEALIKHFLINLSKEFNLKRYIDLELIERLKSYQWPGNVRELRNLVESLLVTVEKEVIKTEDIPVYLQESLEQTKVSNKETMPLKEVVDNAERQAIVNTLKFCKDTHSAAEVLGINYTTLMRKIKKLQIEKT
ncbi:MAG: sigma-54-dependent Fis family transcriptional regulator [Firmicutes bacterium]|nr:sigma-54-dependent Fis family transcriptional regulator [Bacillota bacterium]